MFDVTSYAKGYTPIKKYIHRNVQTIETLETQRRVLKRWNHQRSQLLRATQLDYELIQEAQLKTISVMVDFAYSMHPFYNKLYNESGFRRGDIITWEDYESLPIISKDHLIDHFDKFKTALSPKANQVTSARTSGSSGRVVEILIDPVIDDIGTIQEMRFYEQMLGRQRKEDELVYMIYLDAPPFSSMGGKYPTFAISNECPPEIALRHIQKVKPAILTGFASYFNRMTNFVKNPESLGLKAISTNSETSTEEERRHISDVFGVPVFDEYSSVELGYIATQCSEGKYHLIEDNIRADIINPDENGIGQLVATDLNNTYFPIIRYLQGDTMSIAHHSKKCSCGNHFRQLNTFGGRSDQTLVNRHGTRFVSDQIMALYDRILLDRKSCIEEFRIVQVSVDEIELYYKLQEGAFMFQSEFKIRQFAKELRALLKDNALSIKPIMVQEMPQTRSHKRRLIENRILTK